MDAVKARKRTRGAVAVGGGPYALARAMRDAGTPIAPQAITQWVVVPPAHARLVSRITGIPLHVLRPDLWEAKPAPAARSVLRPRALRAVAA